MEKDIHKFTNEQFVKYGAEEALERNLVKLYDTNGCAILSLESAFRLGYSARAEEAGKDTPIWGASTLGQLDAALDGAHELSGAPHERISELIRQRSQYGMELRKLLIGILNNR